MASVAAPTETLPSQPQSEFVKAVTLTDATVLVAVIMIGSGIFIDSADVPRKVESPAFLLLAWALFVVIQTRTIAAVAIAFGRFFGVLAIASRRPPS